MADEDYARLLAALPEPALLVTPRGVIRAANRAAAECLAGTGLAPAGRNLAEFVEAPAALDDFLRLAARSGQMVPGTVALGPAGRRMSYRAEGALVQRHDGAGEALLFVRLLSKAAAVSRFVALNLRIEELNREIARRRRAEDALRHERELLRVTLASIGDAVIATDRAGRVTFMNEVAEQQTGWRRAEAEGRPLSEVFVIVNEATRQPVENPVDRVLRENLVVGLANHTLLIRRDGRAHAIDDAGAPIRDAEGNVLGVVLVFRDVTERRAMERQREEAERRKDEFLAMLAHELRNPLAAIASGVDVMRRTEQRRAGNDPQSGVLEAMQRQVRQLSRLVEDLLDASRIVTGKISLRLQPLELHAAVEDALAVFRPAMAARGIQFSWRPAPGAPRVQADAERLAQVIGNLLSNAVKFNTPGGRVDVATAVEDGWARVTVADSGEGIAAEFLPSIFDMFVQGDTSLDRARGGLGVGLSVARVITEMHGGRIEARSAGPGKGSEFTVRLPLHQAAAAPRPRPAAPMPARVARSVLVVDDNADAANSLAQLLRLSGHQAHVAHDGPTALRLQEESPAEVILLDLGMPGMDGYEVARRIRARSATPRPHIFALTGYGADSDRARARAAGFDGHLTKPLAWPALEALLGSLGR